MATFFLEGDKCVGKSTILRQVLQEAAQPLAGFYAERQRDHDGAVIGFELKAASELFSIKTLAEDDRHWFLKQINSKKRRNLAVFETFGLRLLQEALALKQGIILLDEIGGIELLSDRFAAALLQVLEQSEVLVVGVFKSEKNFQQQKRNSLEPLAIEAKRQLVRQAILAKGQLLSVTSANLAVTAEKLAAFCRH